WIRRYELEYPILLDFDGDVGRLYDARKTPHMYVIDKEGILRYHGAIDDNKFLSKPEDQMTNYVVNAVRQIVEGETVTPEYTKPYGCSVKYKPRRQ
ncbi:MAG: redoxin domain-containing protein, partial [Planctomycetota bacterium]